jgi:hypothetical protein
VRLTPDEAKGFMENSDSVRRAMEAAGYRFLPVGIDGEFVWALPIRPFGMNATCYIVGLLRTGNEMSDERLATLDRQVCRDCDRTAVYAGLCHEHNLQTGEAK